jgi:phosphoserine phosphatase
MRFPNGESFQELISRAADVLRHAMDRHSSETIVMVSHDSVIRALLLQALDQPLSAYWRLVQDPCGISEITIAAEGIRVARVNESTHLRSSSR